MHFPRRSEHSRSGKDAVLADRDGDMCLTSRLSGPPQISANGAVGLDYRFPAEDDVLRSQDGGLAGDLVAGVLRRSERFSAAIGVAGAEDSVRSRCTRP